MDNHTDFTLLNETTSKPSSYKNVNSSQTTQPPLNQSDSDTDSETELTNDSDYFVITFNNTPKFVSKSLIDADQIMHSHILEFYNRILPTYTNSYANVRIILTNNGYQVIEHNAFIPFYDNILLTISSYKVNSI